MSAIDSAPMPSTIRLTRLIVSFTCLGLFFLQDLLEVIEMRFDLRLGVLRAFFIGRVDEPLYAKHLFMLDLRGKLLGERLVG